MYLEKNPVRKRLHMPYKNVGFTLYSCGLVNFVAVNPYPANVDSMASSYQC